MNGKIGVGLGVFFLFVIGIVCIYEVILVDRKGPEIKFVNGENLTYVEGKDEDQSLLVGVTAYDKKDGDVTNTLVIKNKVVLSSGTKMVVEYAAMDKSKNITCVKRKVDFIKSEDTGNNENKEDNVNNEVNPDENPDNNAGENQENNNYESDSLEEQIAKADETGIPFIRLNATEATISLGQDFNYMTYVEMTYDHEEDVSRRIRIQGADDLSQAGDYKVYYSVSDTEGNISEPVEFTIHVKEGEAE